MIYLKKLLTQRVLAVLLLSIGGLLLAYALLQHSSKAVIPGWIPVNEPLQEALEALESSQKSMHQDSEVNEKGGGLQSQSPPAQSQSPPAQSQSPPAQSPITEQQVISSPDSTSPQDQLASKDDSALIDLNKATQAELETLPGIGPSKASAIITYREKNNGFRKVEQLLEVKGIGEKMLERVILLVRVTQ